jgi:release factor glutamine methyltransferase
MTIHDHVAAARAQLRDAGISKDEADLDARLLAEFVLGWTTERFFTAAHQQDPDGFAGRFQALVERRAAREPLAYIVGRQEFWGLSFEVSPAVLIPRPETELIVEAALDLLQPADRSVVVADVCTGSGCIAVAFAHERPAARVVAADISDAALDVARRNAAAHGVASRIEFRRADLLDGLDGPFDLIAANPPYVAERDSPGLQPEVRDYEPAVALFGGFDGRALMARLIPQAAERLRPRGYLLFEFGFGQDENVEELIARTSGLRLIDLRRDLQGIARTAVVQRTT